MRLFLRLEYPVGVPEGSTRNPPLRELMTPHVHSLGRFKTTNPRINKSANRTEYQGPMFIDTGGTGVQRVCSGGARGKSCNSIPASGKKINFLTLKMCIAKLPGGHKKIDT